MTKHVITVRKEMTINNLINLFLDKKFSCAPVVDADGGLVGIVTKTDILGHFLDLDLEISVKVALQDIIDRIPSQMDTTVSADTEMTVGRVMTPDPLTAEAETPIDDLAAQMIEHNIHRLILTENGAVCGLISTLDILYHVAGIEKHA